MAFTPFNTNLGGSTQAGRPIKASSLIVLNMPDTQHVFEMANQVNPSVMKDVNDIYMKVGSHMPNLFQSTRMSPTGAPEQMRRRRISKGFV